ncbi:ABC transporter substrate-binding protein [Catellatospora bangladeshensis]|uniref:ABC transporter substrate-binding protein n=1 Tax=Catellatospora bangladeshensis TaxID=310355 RepID=UPI0036082F53
MAAILLATAACTDDGAGPAQPSAVPSPPAVSTEDRLVFGMGEPRVLDPALAADAESLRITRQVLETLVRAEPGGARTGPGLAEEFRVDATGTVWTFRLKQGVTFHDGTAFDAAAVCANFGRWYRFDGALQAGDLSAYWQTVFGGSRRTGPAACPPACSSRAPLVMRARPRSR